jgi:hypothetical protein
MGAEAKAVGEAAVCRECTEAVGGAVAEAVGRAATEAVGRVAAEAAAVCQGQGGAEHAGLTTSGKVSFIF